MASLFLIEYIALPFSFCPSFSRGSFAPLLPIEPRRGRSSVDQEEEDLEETGAEFLNLAATAWICPVFAEETAATLRYSCLPVVAMDAVV